MHNGPTSAYIDGGFVVGESSSDQCIKFWRRGKFDGEQCSAEHMAICEGVKVYTKTFDISSLIQVCLRAAICQTLHRLIPRLTALIERLHSMT